MAAAARPLIPGVWTESSWCKRNRGRPSY